MSDDPGLTVSAEDVEVHLEHPSEASQQANGEKHHNAAELQNAQKRLLDVESAHESLKKGTSMLHIHHVSQSIGPRWTLHSV